jgi:hypothetical protein
MRFVLPLLCCCSAMLFMYVCDVAFCRIFFAQRTWARMANSSVCVGPLRTFLHSRVYLSPVGRAPKFDKFEFASAHDVDFYTVVFI